VLVHDGRIRITNDEERMFMGRSREDLHPRTAMGYTRDGRLLILAVEGRNRGHAEGASLTDLAGILLGLGAVEALNLDGGGSSCLLVMGRETIKPSDKEGQRAVPGVFLIGGKAGR
jgi:exopolysaccharide biosynthesis protein